MPPLLETPEESVPEGTFVLDGERKMFSPVCVYCKHLDFVGPYSCDAFKLIPRVIWDGKNDHTQPFPGDNGIRFEPANPEVYPK